MKFTAFQDKLNKGITLAIKVVARNVSLPILENFLLKTEAGRLKILATNLEQAIEIRVAGKIEKQGQTTVPANILAGLISNLNEQKITLELKNNLLKITSNDFEGEIKAQDPDDFPVIPEVKQENSFTFKTEKIKQALDQLLNIVPAGGTRPEISGIVFRFLGSELKMAATDSFRLAEKALKLSSKTQSQASQQSEAEEPSFILPFRAAAEVNRLLEAAGEEFELSFDKNQALFNLNGVRLTSRLIEGNFPDYEQIIPEKFTTELLIDKQELLKKIKLVSVLASESNAVAFALNASSGSALITAASSAKGASQATLQQAGVKGESVKVSFNWRYLSDGLNNLDGDRLVFRLNGSERPSLMKTQENQDYFYLVMPIRE